jgi:hypothetical protein
MSRKTKRRPFTDEERAERRAAEREQMREAVEALRSSEGWQRWFEVRRHFHTYTFHNQLMIAMQCPEATRVSGFRRWLELGQAVRKGERAIRIWTPCMASKKALAHRRKEGSNPDDEPRTWFRLVPVFGTLSRAWWKRARRSVAPFGKQRVVADCRKFKCGTGGGVICRPPPASSASCRGLAEYPARGDLARASPGTRKVSPDDIGRVLGIDRAADRVFQELTPMI